jgi:hypothetical protein
VEADKCKGQLSWASDQATGWKIGEQGLDSRRGGLRVFSLYAASRPAHMASYRMGTSGNGAGESNWPLTCIWCPEITMREAVPPFSRKGAQNSLICIQTALKSWSSAKRNQPDRCQEDECPEEYIPTWAGSRPDSTVASVAERWVSQYLANCTVRGSVIISAVPWLHYGLAERDSGLTSKAQISPR